MSLKKVRYINSTALSKYFCQLKKDVYTPIIIWDIIAKTKSSKWKGKRCNICLVEKIFILKYLNRNNEKEIH